MMPMQTCYLVSLYFESDAVPRVYHSTLVLTDTPESAIRIASRELKEKYGQSLVVCNSCTIEVDFEFLEKVYQTLKSQQQ